MSQSESDAQAIAFVLVPLVWLLLMRWANAS